MSKITAKLIATVSASLLALGLSGCSVGPIAEAPPAPDTSTTDGDGASDSGDSGDTGSDGDDGRVFSASQEIVAKSLLAAISKAERVEWEGKNIYIFVPEGSVNDPTATIGCLAAQTVIADDETAFMVFSDGEIDCSTRY